MIRRGFALVELILATLIIGFSVVSLLVLVTTQTRTMSVTSQTSQAIHLANNVHEFAMSLPLLEGPRSAFTTTLADPQSFSNVSHLDGWDSGSAGPINCDAERIPDLEGWEQSCEVKGFNLDAPNNLFDPASANTSNINARKLTVTVTYRDEPVYVCSWLLAPTVQY